MPHATKTNGVTNGKMSNQTSLTNGQKSQSQFVSHLISYPVVNDSITTVQSTVTQNPYGKRSVNLAQRAYAIFLGNIYKPVSPYLQTPYSYISPYIAKADSLGDSGLTKIETQFPIVKEETPALKQKITETAQFLVGFPKKKAGEAKDYVWGTYEEELNKTNEKGYVGKVKAVFSTELRITAEVLTFASNWISSNAKKVQDKSQKKVEQKKSS